jgi:hypothetical protein
MAAQVGNEHPEPVSQEFDERIEHRARRHETVQQKQRLTFAFDAEEDAIGCAVLFRAC